MPNHLWLWGSLVLLTSACGVVPLDEEEQGQSKPPAKEESFSGNEYTVCGCGCCGGYEPPVKCLAEDGGAALNQIIKDDKVARNNPNCPLMGCSFGTTYRYCDRAPGGT